MIARLRALFFGCVLALVLLEVLLRLLTLGHWSTPIFISDEMTGFRQRGGLEIGGLPTNSGGFNDDEPAVTKTGRRLGVVGDSFVFGIVPRELNFVSRLEKKLGPPHEVLNFGIFAAGPENYLGVLEKDVRAQKVDAVMVVFFVGNDVFQADPHFKTRVLLGSPRAVLRSPLLIRFSPDYLYSFKMMRGGWRVLNEEWLDRPEPGGSFSRETFLSIEEDRLEVCRRTPSEAVERGYQGTAAFFAELKRFEARTGIAVAVVLAPDQLQVDWKLREELFARVAAEEFDVRLPQRRLIAMLEEQELRYFDLLPGLRNATMGRPVYHERDTHWNDAGNRFVAARLHEAVQSWGWLDSAARAD